VSTCQTPDSKTAV